MNNENRINTWAVSLSLGIFLGITYILCVVFDLALPQWAMHPAWEAFFPGFSWLTPASFLLGLLESVLYGVYAGLVYVPIYNFVNRRSAPGRGKTSEGGRL